MPDGTRGTPWFSKFRNTICDAEAFFNLNSSAIHHLDICRQPAVHERQKNVANKQPSFRPQQGSN